MEFGEFEVHDYREQTNSFITAMGTIGRSLVIQFWVGHNGPYRQTFLGNEMTPDNVVKFVQGTVADLRRKKQLISGGV